MLQAAIEGEEALTDVIETYLTELATGMFLTGSTNAGELRSAQRVVLGNTREWLLGLDLDARAGRVG
jgi:isopentenyl diphosphate isomerase/L-lactate dehydrogenase-like FMN-dependent dehydrogenase